MTDSPFESKLVIHEEHSSRVYWSEPMDVNTFQRMDYVPFWWLSLGSFIWRAKDTAFWYLSWPRRKFFPRKY